MRYRSLGNSGLLVSVAGLGCNNFGGRIDLQQTRAVVDAAIDVGITLFDTADIYGNGGGSEELLGQVLGQRRDQIVLASKFGHQRVDMGFGPAAGGLSSWPRPCCTARAPTRRTGPSRTPTGCPHPARSHRSRR
jgi:aryl-alcohol dehydrogenase-like predicted oxidoreductase